MNETAQTTDLRKSVTHRFEQRRFSTVQLLIALALPFVCFPFVEEVKGGARVKILEGPPQCKSLRGFFNRLRDNAANVDYVKAGSVASIIARS